MRVAVGEREAQVAAVAAEQLGRARVAPAPAEGRRGIARGVQERALECVTEIRRGEDHDGRASQPPAAAAGTPGGEREHRGGGGQMDRGAADAVEVGGAQTVHPEPAPGMRGGRESPGEPSARERPAERDGDHRRRGQGRGQRPQPIARRGRWKQAVEAARGAQRDGERQQGRESIRQPEDGAERERAVGRVERRLRPEAEQHRQHRRARSRRPPPDRVPTGGSTPRSRAAGSSPRTRAGSDRAPGSPGWPGRTTEREDRRSRATRPPGRSACACCARPALAWGAIAARPGPPPPAPPGPTRPGVARRPGNRGRRAASMPPARARRRRLRARSSRKCSLAPPGTGAPGWRREPAPVAGRRSARAAPCMRAPAGARAANRSRWGGRGRRAWPRPA